MQMTNMWSFPEELARAASNNSETMSCIATLSPSRLAAPAAREAANLLSARQETAERQHTHCSHERAAVTSPRTEAHADAQHRSVSVESAEGAE
ncbi:hypothetical protein MHYP_G00282810 [Metynnis hypsauchen]